MQSPPTSQQHVAVLQDGKSTPLSLNWYHQKNSGKQSFYSRKDNTQVSPLICGSATLPAVADALMAAKSSIEISVWVFDPALTLNGYNQAVTAQALLGKSIGSASPRIGDLLLAASGRGVKVKLLIWNPGDLLYNILRVKRLAEEFARQYPLETGLAIAAATKRFNELGDLGKMGLGYGLAVNQEAIKNWDYRFLWYQAVDSGTTNIQLRTAGPALGDMGEEILNNINKYTAEYQEDIRGNDQYVLAKLLRQVGPSHHQKTVMVDYEDPERACGFVMGNNFRSVDYDTPEHPATPPPKKGQRFPGDKPRHDISAQVFGQALHDINDSFCQNWVRWGGVDLKRGDKKPEEFAKRGDKLIKGHAQVSCTFLGAEEPGFICDAYEAAITCCTSHLYIENQYFRYQSLVEIFKNYPAARKMEVSHAKNEPLYYFIVINKPDSYATGPSYDALKELGHEGQMAGIARERYATLVERREELLKQQPPADPEILTETNKEIDDLAKNQPDIGKPAKQAEDVETPDEAFAVRDLTDKGFKGHVATLTVCRVKPYRPWNSYEYTSVNIHSKLMIIDDIFATIGSANLNTRGMVTDAEMNISTSHGEIAATLRKELFKQHLDLRIVDNAVPQDLYDAWKKRLDENWKCVYNNEPLIGRLTYMYDHKKRTKPTLDS